jgi:hypothetical protein
MMLIVGPLLDRERVDGRADDAGDRQRGRGDVWSINAVDTAH